ncbi:hypothetical protein BJ508DRAFT_377455 [Ascobolus immersus RN42]|uniref:Uncharacterized protein n=1 Tax=Ascobolus immersus RN42 TaxID=1160509 RepID=A0A3N4I0T5_ASCIM|nr:hypothetical protein BJ508DRAFT_377455 [Ascobolus immersus RN42]
MTGDQTDSSTLGTFGPLIDMKLKRQPFTAIPGVLTGPKPIDTKQTVARLQKLTAGRKRVTKVNKVGLFHTRCPRSTRSGSLIVTQAMLSHQTRRPGSASATSGSSRQSTFFLQQLVLSKDHRTLRIHPTEPTEPDATPIRLVVRSTASSKRNGLLGAGTPHQFNALSKDLESRMKIPGSTRYERRYLGRMWA